MLLAVVPAFVTGLSLDSFVPLRVVGLGRYASAPAIFLEEERGGDVLPVPIPGDAVMAVEQALSPTYSAMLEVLLHAQPVSKRDDALFDNVPWAWNPSPQAKRDAFARFSGRGYPREGYQSPYHLILDTLRRDGCADVSRVLIERTSMLDGLVVGGCLCLERRLPQAEDSGATRIIMLDGAELYPASSRCLRIRNEPQAPSSVIAKELELLLRGQDAAIGQRVVLVELAQLRSGHTLHALGLNPRAQQRDKLVKRGCGAVCAGRRAASGRGSSPRRRRWARA